MPNALHTADAAASWTSATPLGAWRGKMHKYGNPKSPASAIKASDVATLSVSKAAIRSDWRKTCSSSTQIAAEGLAT
jgi:hypothetical protein